MISKRTQKIFLRSSMRSMIFIIFYQPLQGLLSLHIQMISIGCYIRQIAIKAGDTVVIVTIHPIAANFFHFISIYPFLSLFSC